MPGEYEVDFENNPKFNTVLNLSNRTFDPENIVSGRGATEDQLKVIWDKQDEIQQFIDDQGCTDDPYTLILQKVTELEERQAVCCDNPQSHIIQAFNTRLDELETRQEACCNNEGATITQVFNLIQTRLTNLETRIGECCSKVLIGNEVPFDDSTCGGNVITLSATWNATGGQINYTMTDTTRTPGLFFFLAEMTNGVYRSRATEIAAGKGRLAIDSLTGAMTFTGGVYDTPKGRKKVVVGMLDNGGCEGLAVITLPDAFWA